MWTITFLGEKFGLELVLSSWEDTNKRRDYKWHILSMGSNMVKGTDVELSIE